MRKRVFSLFLAFVLGISVMPMTTFAEGTEAVTEQEVQSGGYVIDDDITDDDAADDDTTDEDVSGGDAANEDVSSGDAAAEAAQTLLNAPALVAEQDSVHTEADHASMTAWENTDSLPNTAGSYYLTQDVTLTAEWELPSGDITLCLNGKSITLDKEGVVISAGYSGTTFTLYDCQKSGNITHGKDSTGTTYNGCGVSMSYGTFFNMYGGTITNNSCDSSGGGVYVNYGTFNMSDGEISSNTSGQNGGGIELSSSTFTMTDGNISQNKVEDNYGGGIDVSYGSTFTMNGGIITGNTSYTGGGVYVGTAVENYGNNTFNMNGGTITDNTATNKGSYTGGGVYVAKDGIFTVSGAAQITDNKRNEDKNNVYLNDQTITITGALGEDASIGVTTPSVAVVGSPVTIAKGGDGVIL